MLTDISQIPHRSIGVAYVKSIGEHRCELTALGLTTETDPAQYQWDNRSRQAGGVFQYTISGEGRFQDYEHGVTHGMYPGQAFLAPFPSPTKYWLPEGAEWEFLFFCFSGDLAMYHARELVQRHGYIFRLAQSGIPVEMLFHMYATFLGESTPDEFRIAGEIYRFFMELHNHRGPEPSAIPAEILQSQSLAQRLYADSSLSVKDMAAEAGYSKYHFSRLFKKAIGHPPHAYLLRLRLRASIELLANTDMPIKQIALAVGFNDYHYFCNAFKRHTLHTPMSIRQQQDGMRLSDIVIG